MSFNMNFPNDFVNRIICGDCQFLIRKLPSNSIDIIITDPPYGLKKSYMKNDCDLETFYNILPECWRVMKKDSFFITFFSTKFLPALFNRNPFEYFWQIVLYCPEADVRSPIGTTRYMSCYVFKKGNPEIFNKNIDIFKDTPGKMIEPDEGFINHPTPKPKQFIKEILNMFSKENDLVLDPFIGSGSTAVSCIHLNRRFIGFESVENYCRISNIRIEKARKKINFKK